MIVAMGSIPKIFTKRSREYYEKNFETILIRGLEDLPDPVTGAIAKYIRIEAFNSEWLDKSEKMEGKIERLDKIVKRAKKEGKEIVFIGVSAGAALALIYMMKHPENKIRYLFSFSGVLDTRLKKGDVKEKEQIKRLSEISDAFGESVEYISGKLNDKVIRDLDLKEVVYVYSSSGESDGTVPKKVMLAKWVSHAYDLGPLKHVPAIIKSLIMLRIQQRKMETKSD